MALLIACINKNGEAYMRGYMHIVHRRKVTLVQLFKSPIDETFRKVNTRKGGSFGSKKTAMQSRLSCSSCYVGRCV